jgi:quinol monooxygenase YgiN
MYARVTTIWLPPSRIAEAVRFFHDEVVPAMAPQPGLRGLWLFVDRPAGRQLAIGLWETEEALSATTFLYQELRAKVGSLYGGPPIEEPYEARPPEQGTYTVRVAPERPADLAAARVARVTTVQGSPERVEDLVRQLEAQIAPVLARLAGYLGLYLLVDPATGTARSVALWRSLEALEESAAAVAPLRAQAAATLEARSEPTVEVYEVALHAEEVQ